MNMKEAFEKALAENPYDEATHRAYADWCSDEGLDELARFHREWTGVKQAHYETWMDSFVKKVNMETMSEVFPIDRKTLLKTIRRFLEDADGDPKLILLPDGNTVGYEDVRTLQLNNEKERKEFWEAYFYLAGEPYREDLPNEGRPFECC